MNENASKVSNTMISFQNVLSSSLIYVFVVTIVTTYLHILLMSDFSTQLDFFQLMSTTFSMMTDDHY